MTWPRLPDDVGAPGRPYNTAVDPSTNRPDTAPAAGAAAEVRVLGIRGLPDVVPGDDLASLIARALAEARIAAEAGDVFVIGHKIVSKAEGRLVALASVEPSALAQRYAAAAGKDARLIELVLREAVRIVRMDRGVIIAETRHGFVCANAGVDASNVGSGMAALLPEDPDGSAGRLRAGLARALRVEVGVIVADTFGRPWREGQVNVALGVAGLPPLVDYRGCADTHGRPLQASVIAVADEIASAAELVMGKTDRVPAAIVRGVKAAAQGAGSGRELLRPPAQDLFR